MLSVDQLQKLLGLAGIGPEDPDRHLHAFAGLGWILGLHDGFEKRLDAKKGSAPQGVRDRSGEKRLRALDALRGTLRKALESLEAESMHFDLLNAWSLWRVRNVDEETVTAWAVQWLNENHRGDTLSDPLEADLARTIAVVRSLSNALEGHNIAARRAERFTATIDRLAEWWETIGNGKPGYDNYGEPAATPFVRFASKCLEMLDGLEDIDGEPLYSVEVTTALRNRPNRKK